MVSLVSKFISLQRFYLHSLMYHFFQEYFLSPNHIPQLSWADPPWTHPSSFSFLQNQTKLWDVALIREYFPAAPSSHPELWTQGCCSCRKPVSTQFSGGLHLFSDHWLCSDFTAHSASHLIQGKSSRVPDPALDLPSKSLSKMTPRLRPEALESDLYEFKPLFYLKKIS